MKTAAEEVAEVRDLIGRIPLRARNGSVQDARGFKSWYEGAVKRLKSKPTRENAMSILNEWKEFDKPKEQS